MPGSRTCSINSSSEYYPVGHDNSLSVLSGFYKFSFEKIHYFFIEILEGKIMEKEISKNETELIEDETSQLKLDQLNKEELSSLRFFMGGFGDARHLFASLLDLHKKKTHLPEETQSHLFITFVLNDIKPHPTAKLLIVISALKKLESFESNEIEVEPDAAKAAAVLVYLFAGNVMPSYIYEELINIIQDLIETGLKNLYWTKFLKITESDWVQIKSVLEQWSKPCPFSTQQMMNSWKEENNVFKQMILQPETEDGSCVDKLKDEYKKNMISQLEELSDEQLNEYLNKRPETKNLSSVKKRELLMKIIDNMSVMDIMKTNEKAKSAEGKFAKNHYYMLPPKIILSEEEKTILFADKDQEKSYKKMDNFVKKSWKPNCTMIDYDWLHVLKQITNPEKSLVLELGIKWDPEELLDGLLGAISRTEKNHSKQELFKNYALYFHALAKSFKSLTEKNCFRLESYVDDVHQLLFKLKLQATKQNQLLSFKFDRIYLSNIPDYASLLYAFLGSMPLLKFNQTAFMTCNVMMNCSIWKKYSHYVYAG